MNSTETTAQKDRAGRNGYPRIAAFCCYHSAYEAADAAGSMKLQIPEGVRIVRVPCTGRVDVLHLLRAVEKGYDGILVLGCHEENCKFLHGNTLAKKRVKYARQVLAEAGIKDKDIEFHGVAPNQPHRFAQVARAMHERLTEQDAEAEDKA